MPHRIVHFWLGLAVILGGSAATRGLQGVGYAQPQAESRWNPADFGEFRWRNIGPNRGGRSIAVAGSSARPLEYYFGATGGGLWKTTDGGTTWVAVSDTAFASSSVGAVAVAPSNPDVVYAGMGEAQLRGNIIQGDGVYKSTDGGKTWTHVGLERTRVVSRIRIHPSDPDLVYVSALGDPYGANDDRGVYRSRDGGGHWERVLFRDAKTGAVDLALDPKDPAVLYAALWEAYRTPHSLSSGGPGSGLFKSTDGGATWTELTRNPGLPEGLWGKVGVSVSGVDANRVYAIVENEKGGVFVSDDAGSNWTRANDDRRLRQRAFYYTRIYADPKSKDTVYVLNTGFYRSTDGGKTYRPIRVPHGDNHDLWIDPADPKRMINSNDGGANVSVNGGESWTDQDYPTAQFYNVFTTRHEPYHVCGAQQDNSTACVSSAETGDVLYAVGGGESGYVAPHPAALDVFFAGSYGGLITRFDRATGQSRRVNAWPENPMGHSSVDIRERFQWTFPIVFSPRDPHALYIGSQHLWKSTNEGQRWERISPDLTRADPATMGPSGGPITLDQTGVETYATIFTIAPSPHAADTIWVGSDDGIVHVTRDGGKSWRKVTPPDLPEFTRISLIEVSPHKPATAFLAANRYQRADRAPYVYRTDDYGETWSKITSGLPREDFARAIREDITRPGLLYLGTEHGIYVSFDNGAGWQSLRLNLPVTPVHGIAVTASDLVIGTHGRSFWILPRIGVLRQWTPDVPTATMRLFTPHDVVRSRLSPIASTWRGSGGFGAPTASATIDYFLSRDAEVVKLELLDGNGHVVRLLTNSVEEERRREDARKKASAGGEAGEEEGTAARPLRLGLTKGHHRFSWDLRYESAKEFPGLIMWGANTRGPIAPPGIYQARLTALGETQAATLTIQRDPRLEGITDQDLHDQFRLAKQINDRVTMAHEAVIRIRHVKAQVEERAKVVRHGRVTEAAAALVEKLTEVEGEVHQYRNQSSQDPLNYPIKLNNKLAALQGIVEGADGRPTDQSRAVFEDLAARLDAQLARVEELMNIDLAAFNRLLGRRAAPVTDSVPTGDTGEAPRSRSANRGR